MLFWEDFRDGNAGHAEMQEGRYKCGAGTEQSLGFSSTELSWAAGFPFSLPIPSFEACPTSVKPLDTHEENQLEIAL